MLKSTVSHPSYRAAWIAKRRAEARRIGLCLTCCKQTPAESKRVCQQCVDAVGRRRKRRRLVERERKKTQLLVRAHEQAGDAAQERHLYQEAMQHYHNALGVQSVDRDTHSRLSEKLARIYFVSENPDAANPLFERSLASHLASNKHGIKAVGVLLSTAQQLWIDSMTEQAVPLTAQALQIAEIAGDYQLQTKAKLRMANYLRILGRYDEAAHYLNAVTISEETGITDSAFYYSNKGDLASIYGDVAQAYACFEKGIAISKQSAPMDVSVSWTGYGLWAIALGDIDLAKTCHERALFIARQNHVGWRIPYACLEYSRTLATMGQYTVAYEYFLDALSYDAKVPVLSELRAEVGIPLALLMHDKRALNQCAHPEALEFAFRSKEPDRIAPVAAAFAQLYAKRGDKHKARMVLHRGLEAMRGVDLGWELLLTVARDGMLSDIPVARQLFEARMRLPKAEVAEACVELFDAYANQRNNRMAQARSHALRAVERFERLHWYGYADRARALLPDAKPIQDRREEKVSPDMRLALTAREQQVAELALKGLTNRAIAQILAIKERTVETHMTSIMGRLGVRSRHQLLDVLPPEGEST